MYIIDFDDTLFNTVKLKQARREAVAEFGISAQLYEATYEEAYKTLDEIYSYSNERHAEVLALKGFDKEEVYKALSATTSADVLPTFINDGAYEFLKTLKETGQPLVLLSLGDPSFQELKTIGSGVHEYFDRTFMVDETKQHVLQELFSNHAPSEAWFINDKIDETKELAAYFPEMNVVLKKSERYGEDDYTKSGFPYFYTLKEIAEYVIE